MSESAEKFKYQDEQYTFPYHHLVSLDRLSVGKVMDSGVEYFCYMRKAIECAEKAGYHTLLDVGCGDGRMITHLAPKNPERTYVGVDLSERAIDLANALTHDVKNARFLYEDVNNITEQYDVVTCIETMEHIPEKDILSFVKGIHACVKDEGGLVVSVPSTVVPLQDKHFRHYTRELLQQHLPQFEIVSIHYVMRDGFMRDLCVRMGRKFSNVGIIQKLVAWVGKRFVFDATTHNGRHIVAVFKKK